MKRLLVILLLAGVCHAAEPDYVGKLRAVAAKRHLYFKIFCTDSGLREFEFLAVALPTGMPYGAYYVEDGARPWWGEYGSTQREAGMNPMRSLEGPPNIIPDRRPKPALEREHRQCPPPIEGGQR